MRRPAGVGDGNLGAAIGRDGVSQFTDTIRAFVALAVLMPIVASMGGTPGRRR